MQLRLLGPMAVIADGKALPLPASRKTRALLGYLAAQGKPVRRDRLTHLFWEVPDDPKGALRWSLTKLRDYLAEHKHIRLSRETIRQVLKDARISWQNTKTWKHSKDPEFTQKKDRILGLYDHPPPDGRVICVDEFGPLNLQPRPGKGWYPHQKPKRFRATYTRTGGVRHMFAALDLSSGEMFYRFRDRKRWREFLGFLKQLRRRFPTGRLYLVCDNYGSHG